MTLEKRGVFFRERLSPPVTRSASWLFHDRRLQRHPAFRQWSRQFPQSRAVTAGEALKDVKRFPELATALLRAAPSTMVVAGGGSVGDVGGFLASTFRRGIAWHHLPTTWLAALDSAHGGKTALNVDGTKNQFGTFHPAERVEIVRELLVANPPARVRDAFGELAKIGFIDGGAWFTREKGPADEETLWRLLPAAVAAKYRIVDKDPQERVGLRRVLNLGHTLGHVLEVERNVSHGEAVGQGLFFALRWSARLGMLPPRELRFLEAALRDRFALRPLVDKRGFRPLARARARTLLARDKKRVGQSLQFVFLEGLGGARLDSVTPDDIVAEARSQGWID